MQFHRWFRVLVLLFVGITGSASLQASTNHHVILITIDGFAAYYFKDPLAPIPTLRRLAAEGAVAEGMRVANPAITWPNHTTLVTGVHPEKHSVLFNGVLVRGSAGKPVQVDPKRDKADLVAVPTLFDQLFRGGYRTAGVNWPCTRNAGTLHDDLPDVPEPMANTTPALRAELLAARILENTNEAAFRALSPPSRDQAWTATVIHLLQRPQPPNLLLFHLLVTDSTQHKYGPQSPAAYTALAFADAQIADLVRALERLGLRDRTTLLITADHGFAKADKIIHPNVAFRKAGLLTMGAAPVALAARAQIVSEGGIAMVYLTDPSRRAEDQEKVVTLMKDHEGISEILRPEQFGPLRVPMPGRNPQMADLILVAKEGYGFSNDARGESSLTEVTLAAGSLGHHGCLTSDPRMNASFLAWGRAIKRGTRVGLIENVDVAPTMARLLGQEMKGVDGRVLTEILDNP